MLRPQAQSSFCVNGRHRSSLQVATRLIADAGLNPCLSIIFVTWLIRMSSGTALGKWFSMMSASLENEFLV